MEIEVYGNKHKKKKHKKRHLIMLTIGIFLLILSLLIYPFFNLTIPLTGNDIIKGIANSNESNIKLDAKLTVPSLDIDGKFEKIEISGNSDSYLNVGGEKFYLGDIKENYLIFYNYDGKISFDSENILEFKGKSTEVYVNGVSITPQSKSTFKTTLDNSFDYKYLEIDNVVSISKLAYKTSGILKLNNEKEIFNVYDDEIIISDFYGNLSIKNKEFYIDGYINELDIMGDSKIHIEN